jgi:hypothetical protein
MAGGWQDLTDTLNQKFETTEIDAFARDFRVKHGDNGQGGSHGKYKFGHFVRSHQGNLLTENQKFRFLIDSGARHWGGSRDNEPNTLKLLEETITHSLTAQAPGPSGALAFRPKKITFTIETDYNAKIAKAVVTAILPNGTTRTLQLGTASFSSDLTTAERYEVTITCPPPD